MRRQPRARKGTLDSLIVNKSIILSSLSSISFDTKNSIHSLMKKSNYYFGTKNVKVKKHRVPILVSLLEGKLRFSV